MTQVKAPEPQEAIAHCSPQQLAALQEKVSYKHKRYVFLP